MILFINSTDFNSLTLALADGAVVKTITSALAFNENYKTNDFLQKFMQKSKVQMRDLTKVIVCSGPGSFTGIRVGVSLSQALGFALKIPVIAIPKSKVPTDLTKLPLIKDGKSLTLNYGQKPNITKSKK